MNVPPNEVDIAVESRLMDLGAIPLATLRQLNGTEFNRTLRYVVEQTGTPRLAKGGSCSNLGFD
jgi:hypothetical protein